jgi:hypothetical protein
MVHRRRRRSGDKEDLRNVAIPIHTHHLAAGRPNDRDESMYYALVCVLDQRPSTVTYKLIVHLVVLSEGLASQFDLNVIPKLR